MSKRHQASRRRTYGRRQHELHERFDRHPHDETEEIRLAAELREPSGTFGRYGLGMARPGLAFLGLD